MPTALVYVCAYRRVRFGSAEYVCAHTRRWPRQSSFSFMN